MPAMYQRGMLGGGICLLCTPGYVHPCCMPSLYASLGTLLSCPSAAPTSVSGLINGEEAPGSRREYPMGRRRD